MDVEGGRRILSVALLVLAILFGGGSNPLLGLIVDAVAVVLLAVLLVRVDDTRSAPLPAVLLIGAAIALPLAQLVPLPAEIWRQLPGHALAADIADVAGLADVARPLSLDPAATWRAFFALLPPVAMFLTVLRANGAERRLYAAIVVVGAFASLLLGIAQKSAGLDLYLFRWAQRGAPVGLFANYNHQADLLLMALIFVAMLAARTAPALRALAAGGAIVFSIGVVFTQSRTGLVLLPLALIVCAALLFGAGRERLVRAGVAIAMIAVPIALILAQSTMARQALSRFDSVADDLRPTIWRTTWTAAQQALPLGTGFGSFPSVYPAYEGLNTLSVHYVNHAHNDYLELLLEGGIPTAVLILAYVILVLVSTIRRRGDLAATLSAVGILVLLSHSLVDYPLRTASLATIFALLNGLLLVAASDFRRRT